MPRSTTTADRSGGYPRLVLAAGGTAAVDSDAAAGVQREFPLLSGRTVIGSGAGADVTLAGLADRHGEVRRDAAGDYVYVHLGPANGSRVNGQPVSEAVLHTGDRIEVGGWVLSYARDEYADHTRPDGGRQGESR
jgi:hypothetical protein